MSNYPFETFPLTKRIGIVNPVSNLDARYGPWPTFNDALTSFSTAVRQRGLTVAVSSVGGVVEYWYKDGIADNNLVLKSSNITEADILPTVTNHLSTNSVTLCSLNVRGSILSADTNLTNIFAPINLYQTLTGNWQTTYIAVCSLSAAWEESADIIPTITNFLSTNNVLISALTITNAFSGFNSLTINGNISGNNLRTSFNQGSATGEWSFAVNRSRAFGNSSHAEGINCIASGSSSHAEGSTTRAIGSASHAEGATTEASGIASHAEGGLTQAVGINSHAEGQLTVAFGNYSHAAGFRATAAQNNTYIWSDGNVFTDTVNVSTTRLGQYMISASGGVFIPGRVGIGTDSIANALTIVGNVSATGIVYSVPTIRTLASNEFNLNAELFSTFVKQITGPNVFTYSDFTSGRTVTLYLCASHLNFSRHYFPQTTYISDAGEGNVVYTFENHITKVTLQNIGTQFIGTTDIIPINIEQVIPVAPIGASIILEDRLGYLKQEDGSYILL